MKDLIVLVADKNMEFLMKGLLPRIHLVEGIHEFTFDLRVHPLRDPGVYNNASEFLRPLNGLYKYAIAMLDLHGSGKEQYSREAIEKNISESLEKSGWESRSTVICIDPELENWIWVKESVMEQAIAWQNNSTLFEWLDNKGLKKRSEVKPSKPKEAFESAIRACNTPRSSSLYEAIANNASYRSCEDPAFVKLRAHLIKWFHSDSSSISSVT